MPWFKVDDGFAFHRKAIKAGNAALGLWVRAGSWCAQQLTDGHVPEEMLPLLGASIDDAQSLVAAGLWDPSEGGFDFRGWHDFQPTRVEVEEERAKARERQKTWRKNKRNGVSNAVTDGVTNAASDTVTDAVSHGGSNGAPSLPFPTLPDPTPKETSEVADAPSDDDSESDDVPPVEDDRPDIERVCKHLQERMVENGYPRPAITQRWRVAARGLMGRDGKTEAEVHAAIDWAHNHEFWRTNIRSLPTLRKQFQSMYLQAKTEMEKANRRTGPTSSATDDADAQTRRFLERHGGAA